MIADDFIILFVSGYIFEDVLFIYKHLPTIDFIMTFFSEQINPMNSIFILAILIKLARLSNQNQVVTTEMVDDFDLVRGSISESEDSLLTEFKLSDLRFIQDINRQSATEGNEN